MHSSHRSRYSYICWNILAQLGKVLEKVRRHGPGVDVADALLKKWRYMVFARVRIVVKCVLEGVRPEDL